MKKIVLILFLFYAKTVAAQTFYAGAEIGITNYTFRPSTNVNSLDVPTGLCAQYIFNGNLVGIESNLIWEPFGAKIVGQDEELDAVTDFTSANYLSVNAFPKSNIVALQFKAGFFYSHYFTADVYPENDYGPSLAINFSFKVSKKAYLGLEFSKSYGQTLFSQSYSYNFYPDFPPYNSNTTTYTNSYKVTYTTFLLKYIHKI